MRQYISKLNDRNLQRKQATGITNYVLYSLVAIILYKIYILAPEINFENVNSYKLIKLIWFSFNLSFAIFYIYLSLSISLENLSSIRILKYNKKSESYFIKYIIIATFLTTIIPALLLLMESFKLNNYNYSTNEIILFVLSFTNLFLVLSFIFSKKKKFNRIINKTSKYNILTSKIIFWISFLVIAISTYEIFNIKFVINFDKKNLVLICILIFFILILFAIIIENYSNDMFSKDLENLEYEIYLKNLSDIEIREILQTRYMGFLLNDWISFKKEEIASKYELFENDKQEIKKKELELDEIDKLKYPIEYDGRKKEIDNLKKELIKKKRKFIDDRIKEINEILKKDTTLKPDEMKKLKDLFRKLENDKKTTANTIYSA